MSQRREAQEEYRIDPRVQAMSNHKIAYYPKSRDKYPLELLHPRSSRSASTELPLVSPKTSKYGMRQSAFLYPITGKWTAPKIV